MDTENQNAYNLFIPFSIKKKHSRDCRSWLKLVQQFKLVSASTQSQNTEKNVL